MPAKPGEGQIPNPRYARLHEAEDKLTFLREWEYATENPDAEGR